MRKLFITFLLTLPFTLLQSQIIVGYNNPAVAASSALIGTIAWNTPGNIFTSNDVRAASILDQKGITHYLRATDFGFVLPAPCPSCLVTGVEAEIERRSATQPDVAILNAWTSFPASSTGAGPYNFTVTGPIPGIVTNRALVVVIGMENGPSTPAILPPLPNNDSRDVVSVTYGGVPMIQACEVAFSNPLSGTTFWARNEIWFLNDAGIAAAVGNNIVVNAPGPANEFVQFVSAVSFRNVDQLAPIFDFRTDTVVGAIDPFALSNPAPMLAGSCAVTSIVCGNPGNYVFNGGGASGIPGVTFVEGTDINGSAIGTSYSTSTATMMCGNAIVTDPLSGNVAPTYNFSGVPNRQVISMICVQRARDFDNEVRLLKGLVISGTSQATGTTYPKTDAYATYGGAGNLWGTTVSLVEATNVGFGFALSARVQNRQVEVDHMQMRLHLTSTLPVELIDFSGQRIDREIHLTWSTASESNNDYYELHRSSDAIDYSLIQTIDGAGNSNNLLQYIYDDMDAPTDKTNYYKIRQVDFNGNEAWYGPITVAPGDKANSLSLFPNPATTTITVTNVEEINNYVIYNNNGAPVKSGKMQNGDISIEELTPGMYFISVAGSDQKIKFLKF